MDPKNLGSKFGDILARCGVSGRGVSVRLDESPGSTVSTQFDHESVVLRYTPKLFELVHAPADLRAVLEHEACHVLTAPSSKVIANIPPEPSAAQACCNYIDLFREYLVV